jgi:hypothetical protein
MSSTTWGWLLAIIGTLASIAGVVFSILAWVQAGKAKEAAMDAANAARIRNLAHNLAGWVSIAKDLLTAVRNLQFEDSRRAATELLAVLSHNKGWRTGLRQDVSDVEEIVRQIDFVNNYLSDRVVFMEMRDNLVHDCQTIFSKLHEMAGNVDAQVEGL